MTPLETILQHFSLPKELYGQPFELHPLQVEAVNRVADWPNVGLFLDTGTGKTVVEILLSLYRLISGAETAIIIMPPTLVTQWGKWLARVKRVDGSDLKVVEYVGTPTVRKGLSLQADFVLVGIQIFKLDYDRFVKHFKGRKYHVAIDEATMLSNINTDSHEKVFDFCQGVTQDLLTGTPVSNPEDAYGILKFTYPGCYRSKRAFENVHVTSYDFWGKPSVWENLDILKKNLETNTVRVLFEDMYPDAEQPLFIALPYTLDKAHIKLYRELAEVKLLEVEDEQKIDAVQAGKLTHALGQIILNYGHFAGDEKKKSRTLDVIEQRIKEINSKVVVFANYRMSIGLLLRHFEHYRAVAVNGDVNDKQKQAAVSRFVEDPACKVIVIHPKSGGFGLDGLQHVSHHIIFAEPVQSPSVFHQCVARLKRTGQRKRVAVTLLSAEGTVQNRAVQNLIKNDTIAGQVIDNAISLRAAVFGQ